MTRNCIMVVSSRGQQRRKRAEDSNHEAERAKQPPNIRKGEQENQHRRPQGDTTAHFETLIRKMEKFNSNPQRYTDTRESSIKEVLCRMHNDIDEALQNDIDRIMKQAAFMAKSVWQGDTRSRGPSPTSSRE